MSTQLTVVDTAPVSAKALQQQVNAIQSAMKQVMERDVHYGVIPGCGDKPTLLKPGAEKIGLMFRLIPTFDIAVRELANSHREYQITCSLKDLSNNVIGQGVGLCSTVESKYRYRSGDRKCPACSKPAIIKGKTEYGGGWVCFAKKGGCGAKYADGDPQIESQPTGQIENPNIADTYNTVLKIAKKRAHVDAILTCTAASDIFTQDIEDMGPVEYQPKPATPVPDVVPEEDDKIYYYDISMLDEAKQADAAIYLEKNDARFDQDSKCWISLKELKRLQKYEVER